MKNNLFKGFSLKDSILRSVVPILLSLMLVMTFLSSFLEKRVEHGWQDLTNYLTITIEKADGSFEYYDEGSFSVVNEGDKITAYLELPKSLMVKDAVIGFNICHSIINIFYNDEVLYSYGAEIVAQDGFIGNTFFVVPIRDEMWGDCLRIELDVVEDSAYSGLYNIKAMPAIKGIRYFFSLFKMDMLLFIGFDIIFLLAFFVLLFFKGGVLKYEGLFLSWFCLALGIWFLSGNGFFYAFSDNVRNCAHMEYIAFFMMPIPFSLLMVVNFLRNKKFMLLSFVLAIGYTIMFVTIMILNYTTSIHFSDVLGLFQICMMIGLGTFTTLILLTKYYDDESRTITRYGILFSMLVLMAELLRYNFGKFIPALNFLNELSFISAGILVYAGTFTISYLSKLTTLISQESDRKLLSRMAYTDSLTGISNRNYCDKQIEDIETSGEKEFTILFFDMNNLKWVNDTYGHEMGDKFIKSMADIINDIFGNQYFCGRWGGDEFIACITGKNIKYVDIMLKEFDNRIELLNSKKSLPFEALIAYGVAKSTKESSKTVNDAIKEADTQMYNTKVQLYEIHGIKKYR